MELLPSPGFIVRFSFSCDSRGEGNAAAASFPGNPSADPSWQRTGCRRGKCFTQRHATLAPASLGSQPTEHVSHHTIKLRAEKAETQAVGGPIEKIGSIFVCSAHIRLESRSVICAHGTLQTHDRPFSLSLFAFLHSSLST